MEMHVTNMINKNSKLKKFHCFVVVFCSKGNFYFAAFMKFIYNPLVPFLYYKLTCVFPEMPDAVLHGSNAANNKTLLINLLVFNVIAHTVWYMYIESSQIIMLTQRW